MTTPYIDFGTELNNLTERVRNAILSMLELNNLTELTLVKHNTTPNGVSLQEDIHVNGKLIVPMSSYCECGCGDYHTCVTYKLEKHFGKWYARWNDDDDYYFDYNLKFADESGIKDMDNLCTIHTLDDFILLYNRVYDLLSK